MSLLETLTVEQALAALPDGDRIHTFRDSRVALVGADWDRADIEQALREAKAIGITGPMAQGMKHGMQIDRGGGPLFIETRARTDEATP